jgi:hypothetical protein
MDRATECRAAFMPDCIGVDTGIEEHSRSLQAFSFRPRGYFCATVGVVDKATIKAYIESQKWDEGDQASTSLVKRAIIRLSAGTCFRRLQPHPSTFSRV